MVSSQQKKDIFERLMQRETISGTDPEAFKLRDASFATKKLLVQMNNSSDAAEISKLLSQITGSQIDESVAVFTPLYINLSLIHISEPTRLLSISYAVFCLKKK